MSAIYHFSAQIISRADGRSSVAAAAYRSAEKMIDERTGTAHDFTKKRGVFHSEIMLPADAPAAFSDRATLWNAVEKAEKRKNSQLAREIDIALPRCLTHDQKIALAKDYVQKTFVNAGMIADVCFHDLDSDNPHLHVMLTTREVSASGFGNKNRDWNDRELLKEWRKDWASYANRAMENAGHSHRIDHRTLEAQGIDREPQVHLGAARSAMLKKGKRVDSIEPQLERQRLKRAAQQAANDKIKDAQLYAQRESIHHELEQLEQQLHAERERAHEQQQLEARISAARDAIAAAQHHQRELRERIKSARIRRTELEEYQRRVEQELNDRNAKAEGVIEQAREHVEQARKDQRELEKSLREINEAKAEFEAISPFKRPRKRRELNTEIQEIEARISAAKQRKQGLGRSIEGLERSIEVGQQHQRSLGARIGAVRNALHHQQKQQKLRRAVKRIVEPRQAPIEQDEIESLDELESVQHRRPRPRF